MITYPKTSKLERAIYSFLESIENTTIHPNHPESKSDLSTGKSRIVLTAINDTRVGKVLTRAVSAPAIAFACYSNTYPEARLVQESVIERLENWEPADLVMDGQKVETAFISGMPIGPVIDRRSGLFVAEVVYRFNLCSAS